MYLRAPSHRSDSKPLVTILLIWVLLEAASLWGCVGSSISTSPSNSPGPVTPTDPPSGPPSGPGGSTSGSAVIFYSDLESGPNRGGQNDAGTFVTVYGNNFGSNPQVTVGGGQAIIQTPPTPYLWYQKMVIQLGPNSVSGNIVVTTGSGASNGVPFTVRPGNIHFVATTGNDSNTGDFAHPWATLQHAVDAMVAGDITYAMNGVTQAAQYYDGSLIINGSGMAGAPKALVAYPGATVQVGATGSGNCTTAAP